MIVTGISLLWSASILLLSAIELHRSTGMAKTEKMPEMVPWIYDLVLWTMSILVDLFFREVHPRGSWRIPRKGPVIFVAAPHANQVRTLDLLAMDRAYNYSLSIL